MTSSKLSAVNCAAPSREGRQYAGDRGPRSRNNPEDAITSEEEPHSHTGEQNQNRSDPMGGRVLARAFGVGDLMSVEELAAMGAPPFLGGNG